MFRMRGGSTVGEADAKFVAHGANRGYGNSIRSEPSKTVS